MTYSTFSGYSPAMENQTNLAFQYTRAASPYLPYSNISEYSTPSPSSTYGSPSPTAPEVVKPVPRSTGTHSNTPRSRTTENLTPKQLKRRLQNRVSQQAVRRRRNSPARILETHLQELDKQHGELMSFYSSNIESCIQTLTAEIQTLRELQLALAAGTAGALEGFETTLGGQVMLSSMGSRSNSGIDANMTHVVEMESTMGMGMGLGLGIGAGLMRVDQSAAYQNHDFDSNITGTHY